MRTNHVIPKSLGGGFPGNISFIFGNPGDRHYMYTNWIASNDLEALNRTFIGARKTFADRAGKRVRDVGFTGSFLVMADGKITPLNTRKTFDYLHKQHGPFDTSRGMALGRLIKQYEKAEIAWEERKAERAGLRTIPDVDILGPLETPEGPRPGALCLEFGDLGTSKWIAPGDPYHLNDIFAGTRAAIQRQTRIKTENIGITGSCLAMEDGTVTYLTEEQTYDFIRRQHGPLEKYADLPLMHLAMERT